MSNLNPVIETPRKNVAQFIVKIAGKIIQREGSSFSNVSGISIQIDRNVGDVMNKFQLSIIDNGSEDVYEVDRTLSWSNSDRKIKIIYGNKTDPSKMITMEGYITDYSHSFMGNIYKLDISGLVSLTDRAVTQYMTGTKYRIDFRNYYAQRKDTKKKWPLGHLSETGWSSLPLSSKATEQVASIMELYNKGLDITTDDGVDLESKVRDLLKNYVAKSNTEDSDNMTSFLEAYDNYKTVKISTKHGSIDMKIPDLFVPFDNRTSDEYMRQPGSKYDTVISDMRLYGLCIDHDTGALSEESFMQGWTMYWDSERGEYYRKLSDGTEQSGKVRKSRLKVEGSPAQYAAINTGQGSYVWVGGYPTEDRDKLYSEDWLSIEKPVYDSEKKSWNMGYYQDKYRQNSYQAGTFVTNGKVYIHEIVAKLAKLEGWHIGRIVSTAPVETSESFVINGETAFNYILNTLCPKSITVDGSKSNFTAYFKGGKFYFEPFTTDGVTALSIRCGYNIPESPVISFSIKTKGSVLMTGTHDSIASVNSDTGVAETASTTTLNSMRSYSSPILALLNVKNIKKINNANNQYDFTGLGYGTSAATDPTDEGTIYRWNSSAVKNANFNEQLYQFLGYNPYSIKDLVTYISSSEKNKNSEGAAVEYNSNWYNYINSSSTTGATNDKSIVATNNINMMNSVINADLVMYGDKRLKPNQYIQIYNFVKGGRKHWSSGKYWIKSISDTLDSGGFKQRLTLIRFNSDISFFKKEQATSSDGASNIQDIIDNFNNGDSDSVSFTSNGNTVTTNMKTGEVTVKPSSGGGGSGAFGGHGGGGGRSF